MDSKPTVFLSYSHIDTFRFTERLYFALSIYMDVFWDKRIRPGVFPTELEGEIAHREFFVTVMSPNARYDGSWWLRELDLAQNYQKQIIPVRVDDFYDKELSQQFTYADFGEDFDQGFRRLTQLISGEPVSSWEYLASEADAPLLSHLYQGHVPGLISKTLGDWTIVEQLWPYVLAFLSQPQRGLILGAPRTPNGVLRQVQPALEQVASRTDAIGLRWVQEMRDIVQPYVEVMPTIQDSDHIEAGQQVFQVINKILEMMRGNKAAQLDAFGLIGLQMYQEFNAAEKLRELIISHARRSRYLY